MREQVVHFPYKGQIVSAILWYGDNDLIQYWDLAKGKLNLSKMTLPAIKEMTGLNAEDIENIRAAVQAWIDNVEGRH